MLAMLIMSRHTWAQDVVSRQHFFIFLNKNYVEQPKSAK